jgi:hypothetical protein
MADPASRLIVTAASDEFAPSLLALLGSLTLNWPQHPPVLVYDLGLAPDTRALLAQNQIDVRAVPAFCAHWRRHFTWKLWCLDDAPALDVLWLDAGLLLLAPLPEIFTAVERRGYFLVPNQELLDWEASEQACRGCGLPLEFRAGKPTLAGGLMAFRKRGPSGTVVKEALRVALDEANIAATTVAHRHDQALVSLLAHRHLAPVATAAASVYLGEHAPLVTPGQKVWVHRRALRREDALHFAAHLRAPGEPYLPRAIYPLARARALSRLYRVYWYFGRGDGQAAHAELRAAFALDPTLAREQLALAGALRSYAAKLEAFIPGGPPRFLAWVTESLARVKGPFFARTMAAFLNLERNAPRRLGSPTQIAAAGE